jgi:predicted RNase H-like HicB family nuclease
MRRPRHHTIVVRELPAEVGGGYVAVLPGFPGCLGDGDTADAAALNACGALAEWTVQALTRTARLACANDG